MTRNYRLACALGAAISCAHKAVSDEDERALARAEKRLAKIAAGLALFLKRVA